MFIAAKKPSKKSPLTHSLAFADQIPTGDEWQFQVLIRNLKSGVALVDETGRFKVVNPAFMQMFGLDSELNILNVNSQDWGQWAVYGEDAILLHVDDHPVRKAAITGKPVKDRLVGVRNPGMSELTWMLVSTEPILKADGSINLIICTYYDITERKRVEEALQESEGKYRRIVETANEGIMMADPSGKISYANGRMAEMLGYLVEELVRKDGITLVDKLELAKSRNRIERRKNGIVEGYDVKFRRKDGGELWVHASGTPVYDLQGVHIGNLAMYTDITERKRVEDALRESEAKYRAFFENSIDAILLTRPDGAIEEANAEACRIFGMTCDELVQAGRNGIVDTADPRLLELLQDLAKLGRVNGEINLRRKDQTIFPGEVSSGLFKDSNGNVKTIMIIRDITERRQAEENLMTAKAQAELYLDLMGHDINNMHQVAIGYLELARAMTPDDEAEYLDRPLDSLHRSARLIANVRKLQKLKDGAFLTEQMDICQVLRDIVREYKDKPARTIVLNVNGNDHCLVMANELLYDLFSNLVCNAIKHSNDTHIKLILDIDRVQENGNSYYRVMIEDHGPGISDEFKGKIFNRLLRGETNAKGLGLGLYLVAALTDSFNGKVWVEDRIIGDHTRGARFVVMLPAVDK